MALPEGFAALDFTAFHCDTLPGLLAGGRAALAAEAAAQLGSLALRLPDGRAFTYRPGPETMTVAAGDADAVTVIEIDADAWQGLVHELEAAAGLVYAGRIRCARGNAVDLMAWESALRALYNGRPPYRPERLALRDRRGAALDPAQTFAADTAADELAHFLHHAGYLFLRGVFRADEVRALLADADALADEARPGDRLSWWGRTTSGAEVLTRVTRGATRPALATLPGDPRLLALAALADQPLVHKRGEGDGVTVIYKRPGMSEGGLGDLPWHRDCGIGGHAMMCPTLALSVYLREATPESGELAMLPGSHRTAYNAHDTTLDPWRWAARFAARPGDVSVHYGDTVHAAPPPRAADRAAYRVSAIVTFAPAPSRHHRGADSYNDALHQRDDGQIEHLTEVAKRL